MTAPTDELLALLAKATPLPWVDLAKWFNDRAIEHHKRTGKWHHGDRRHSWALTLIASGLVRGDPIRDEDFPMRVDFHDLQRVIAVRGCDVPTRRTVFSDGFFRKEDAALIIAAVNALPALLSREKALRTALEFYAVADNYRKQPVVSDTMGANVPRDCPDKDAHARTLCAGFTGDDPIIPHDCGLPNEMTDPRVSIVLLREPTMWGTPPVLVDDGAKARAALEANK